MHHAVSLSVTVAVTVAVSLATTFYTQAFAAAPQPLRVGQHRQVGNLCVTLATVSATRVTFTFAGGGSGNATPNAVGPRCQPAGVPATRPQPAATGTARPTAVKPGAGPTCKTLTRGSKRLTVCEFTDEVVQSSGLPRPTSCADRCNGPLLSCTLSAREAYKRCGSATDTWLAARLAKNVRPAPKLGPLLQQLAARDQSCRTKFQRARANCKKSAVVCQTGCGPASRKPPTTPGPASLGHHQRAMLDAHNKVRAAVGVGPMSWDPTLAAYAQVWAERLKKKRRCGLEHRTGVHRKKAYGENLAAYGASRSPADAVAMWASEKKFYRAGAPMSDANWMKVGHYTQMVWRSTTRVGCGWAKCGGTMVVSCNYDPPGNVMGAKPY